MAITNIGTGELHKNVVTGRVDATAVVGQEAVIKTSTGVNTYDPHTTAAAPIAGVALHDAAVGEAFPIVKEGQMVVIAGAAVATIGTALAVNAVGRFIAAVATNHVVANSLTTAAADGDEMLVELLRSGYTA